MSGTSYINAYEKQLNERKLALLRTLAGWWLATSKGKGEYEALLKVRTQIREMREYLNQLEYDVNMADVKLPEEEVQS
jgi:glucose-6-phosphate isomerase